MARGPLVPMHCGLPMYRSTIAGKPAARCRNPTCDHTQATTRALGSGGGVIADQRLHALIAKRKAQREGANA